ncbi:hypothetical protein Dimus_028982 [Dionaea muscipula]
MVFSQSYYFYTIDFYLFPPHSRGSYSHWDDLYDQSISFYFYHDLPIKLRMCYPVIFQPDIVISLLKPEAKAQAICQLESSLLMEKNKQRKMVLKRNSVLWLH